MTRTSRNVTVGLVVTLGLAGVGWTVSADQVRILNSAGGGTQPKLRLTTEIAGEDNTQLRRCWTGIRSSSTRSSRRIRRTRRVNGSVRSCTLRSSTRSTASNSAIHPIFVHDHAPEGASRRAAVIAAAHTALVGLFPSQTIGAGCQLRDFAHGSERRLQGPPPIAHTFGPVHDHIERGIAWGTEVAQAVLAWRATDGFGASYPPFTGGTAVGQWRPTPPAFGPMSAQGLAFTTMFVLVNNTQFEPGSPRGLTSATYTDDFNAVKTLGRKTGSTRTDDQTALALFWDGNASVHWNQAANQMARANHLSSPDANRLLAVLNIAMADTAFTTWSGKRFYGSVPSAVTWRPVTSIPLADTDGNPDTAADPAGCRSSPRRRTRNTLLDIPATMARARPSSSPIRTTQTFTLTTTGQPSRTYTSIAQARSDGDNARIWGGMHYPSTVAHQRRSRRGDRHIRRSKLHEAAPRSRRRREMTTGDDDEDHRERWTALAKNAIVIGAVPS